MTMLFGKKDNQYTIQTKIMTIPATKTTTQSQLQEAQETAAQTRTEALKGDKQAVRKLATQQAAQQTPNTVNSDRGIINAKA